MNLRAPHAHEGITIPTLMFKVNLALLPAAPGKPFTADSGARKALHDFATTSLRAAEAPCQASGQLRNLSLWRACSDAYGAAVIVITPK